MTDNSFTIRMYVRTYVCMYVCFAGFIKVPRFLSMIIMSRFNCMNVSMHLSFQTLPFILLSFPLPSLPLSSVLLPCLGFSSRVFPSLPFTSLSIANMHTCPKLSSQRQIVSESSFNLSSYLILRTYLSRPQCRINLLFCLASFILKWILRLIGNYIVKCTVDLWFALGASIRIYVVMSCYWWVKNIVISLRRRINSITTRVPKENIPAR